MKQEMTNYAKYFSEIFGSKKRTSRQHRHEPGRRGGRGAREAWTAAEPRPGRERTDERTDERADGHGVTSNACGAVLPVVCLFFSVHVCTFFPPWCACVQHYTPGAVFARNHCYTRAGLICCCFLKSL